MPATRPGRRWLVLAFAVAYSGFTFGLVSTGFTFWIGPWTADFKAPHSLIMTAYTVSNLILVLLGPVLARMLDIVSVRVMQAAGALVMAAGLALATLTHQFWQLLLLYATIVPLGAAFVGTLPATVIGVRMFPERAGLVNGLMALGMAMGGVMVAVLAGSLVGSVGWRGTFLVAAILVAGVIGPAGWFVLNVQAGAPPRSNEAATAAKASDRSELSAFWALGQPMFWILIAAALPVMFVLTSVPTNIVPIAADAGVDARHAAVVVAAFNMSAAAGSLIGGWLSDRLGPRIIYTGMLSAIAAVIVVLAQRPSLAVMTGAMVVLGLAGGSLLPWSGAVIMRRFGTDRFARVFGLMSAFFIPATFMPILFGAIRDRTGGYQAGLLALLVSLLAPGVVCLLLLRPSAKPLIAPAE